MPAAHAQWVVIDPSNLAQNIMTAARSLEQINNQIRQLQNEAQMLTNQAKNLTGLDFSALSQLRASLSATNQLIQQGQGLAFNVSQMESEFQRLYPDAYSASISGTQMSTDARSRWRNSLEALRTATKVQSQAVQNFASDEQTLTDLVNRSQSAVGGAAGHAGDQPTAGSASAASHPGATTANHARPGDRAGAGAHRCRTGACARSAAALRRERHAVHPADRRFLQPTEGTP